MEGCGKRCTSFLVHGFNFPSIGKLLPIGVTIEDGCFEEGSEFAIWPVYRMSVCFREEALLLVVAMANNTSNME